MYACTSPACVIYLISWPQHKWAFPPLVTSVWILCSGKEEGRRKGGREGRERGRKGKREGGSESGSEGMKEREGGREEGGREGRREREGETEEVKEGDVGVWECVCVGGIGIMDRGVKGQISSMLGGHLSTPP